MIPIFIIYLIKANIALTLFYIAYHFGLRRLTFYTLNRFFLLSGIVSSAIFPLISLNAFCQHHEHLAGAVIYYAPDWNSIQQLVQRHDPFTIWSMVQYIFWAGVIVMTARLAVQLISLFRIHIKATDGILNTEKVKLIHEQINPFSFFKYIYINPSLHSPEELGNILTHEKVHVKGWHTIDVLCGEINHIFYWFNPGAWLVKTAIHENLEFITDRKILQSGADAKAYQYSLIHVSTFSHGVPVVNHFNLSHLKKRIAMMNKKTSSRFHLLRYLLVLPVIAVAAFIINSSRAQSVTNDKAIEMKRTEVKDNTLPMPLPPSPPSALRVESSKRKRHTFTSVPNPPINHEVHDTVTKGDEYYAQLSYQKAKEKDDAAAEKYADKSLTLNPDNTTAQAVLRYIKQMKKYQQKMEEYKTQRSDSGFTSANADNIRSNSGVRVATQVGYTLSSPYPHHGWAIQPDNALHYTSVKFGRYHFSLISKADTTPAKTYPLSSKKVLYIIDGQEKSKKDLKTILTPGDIGSINVLKDKSAFSKYGPKAAGGAIIIKTKEYLKKHSDNVAQEMQQKHSHTTPPLKDASITLKTSMHRKNDTGIQQANTEWVPLEHNKKILLPQKAIYILDGKEVSEDYIRKNLLPEAIGSISVFKGKTAIEKYGPRATNGVIEITSKRSHTISDSGIHYFPSQATNNTNYFVGIKGNLNDKFSKALIIINNKESDRKVLHKLSPSNIRLLEIIPVKDAISLYGKKGGNGAVKVYTTNI